MLKLHPAEFGRSFKPGCLLVLSECPKSAWSPSTCLLVTINGKQSGAGLWAGSGLLTHWETCLPASPLPEHSSCTQRICNRARSILLLSTMGSFGYVSKLPCNLSPELCQ